MMQYIDCELIEVESCEHFIFRCSKMGRRRDKRCSFYPQKENRQNVRFQEVIAWGKKLLIYLFVLHFILQRILTEESLWLGGSL